MNSSSLHKPLVTTARLKGAIFGQQHKETSVKRLPIVILLVVITLPMAAQTAQQQSYGTIARPLPSASNSISPSPGKTNQAMTFSSSLNNAPLYYGTQPPAPQHFFVVRKPDHTEVMKRDFTTSSTASWTPTE